MKLTKPVCSLENIVVKFVKGMRKYEKHDGWMYPKTVNGVEKALIFIDADIDKVEQFIVAIHEALHVAYPDLSEKQVEAGSSLIAEVLWLSGFAPIKHKTEVIDRYGL